MKGKKPEGDRGWPIWTMLNIGPKPQMEMALFMLIKRERFGSAWPLMPLGMTYKEEEFLVAEACQIFHLEE